MARLHLTLALLLAATATAFVPPAPVQTPRPASPSAVCSSRSSEGSSAAAPSLAKLLARSLAAPTLLLTAFLAPSPMLDGGAAWAISGGGKDWVRMCV